MTKDEALRAAREAYRRREIASALAHFDEALALGADPAEARGERWACAMLLGDFERAWRESDAVIAHGLPKANETWPLHERLVWDGRSLAKRRVLVRCHHGLGDTIQFARYLPALRAVASHVSFACQPELAPLFGHLADNVVAPGTPATDFDAEIEIMELAHALRLRPEQVLPPPYVQVAAATLDAPGVKVGVAWNVATFRSERTAPAELFARLADVPGVSYYGLQKFAPPAEQALVAGALRFRNPEGAPDRLGETAELIAGLDLVVTIDTMVAHLAGAMDKEVFLLLHFDSDWRWGASGEESPWYPSVRIFRPAAPGDWAGVIQRVNLALSARSVL